MRPWPAINVGSIDRSATTKRRNGHFALGQDGTLMTAGGMTVVGQGGPITLPSNATVSELTVDNSGAMRVGNRSVDTLKLEDFVDYDLLRRVGPSLFAAPTGINTKPPADPRVLNRALEGSNSSVFEEMSELISCMRAYEACQRMLKIQDTKEGNVIKQLS